MTIFKRLLFFLAAFSLLASGALAQQPKAAAGEPTVAQVYQAASSGNLDRANEMIDQVLKAHPGSARAHYVKAELAARGRNIDVAKQELAAAEKIAPGLPFAKAEAVQALRNQIANASADVKPTAKAPAVNTAQRSEPMAAPAEAAKSGFPWGTLIMVGAIVGIGAMFLRRRQRAMEEASAAANYANPGVSPGAQPGYGPGPGYYAPNAGATQPYPPGNASNVAPGYPQQQPSMGGSIARGVGTGLAVGAGVFAAQEIGRRMFDHGTANAASLPTGGGNPPTLDQIDEGMRHNLNTDMGGDNFGIADGGGGWDGGGGGGGDAGGDGGGGDW